MILVLTNFTCNDGHLMGYLGLEKTAIIKSIEEEVKERGSDWLEDHGVTVEKLKSCVQQAEFIMLLERISTRGYLELKIKN